MGGDLAARDTAQLFLEPADSSATISVTRGTSNVSIMTEPDSVSWQSPGPSENNAAKTQSLENEMRADEARDEETTITTRGTVPGGNIALAIQTVKDENEDLQTMIRQPESRPISHDQLEAEVKGIYAGLVMVESKSIDVDKEQMLLKGISLDVIKLLEKVPHARLVLLQDSKTKPEETVRDWLEKVRMEAVDKKSLTPKATQDLSTTSNDHQSATSDDQFTNPVRLFPAPKDDSASPGGDSSGLHISKEVFSQVPSFEDCLAAFQVALESRAKNLKWPEYKTLAELTMAEIGEEGRNNVLDRKGLLEIGYDLVDKLMRDLETTADEKSAREETKKAAEVNSEQVSAAKYTKKGSGGDPKPKTMTTHTSEMLDAAEARSRPFSDTRQPAPDKTCIVQQDLDQDTGLSIRESHASCKDPGVASHDSAVGMADIVVGTVAHTSRSSPTSTKKPSHGLPLTEDPRPLHDRNQYRVVGNQIWVLNKGQFIPSLEINQFQALTALHRILLEEHHDFLLASQHPSALPTLKGLATNYAMPMRLWRHGIHSFLEVLLKRLPESREFIVTFIHLAYGMMSLLDETVPSFLSTWIECKGDLARYGMATQNKSMKAEQQRWPDISTEQYTRLLDKGNTVGRIYHHLAILARPLSPEPDECFDATVSQLFYYTKALVVEDPFVSARQSLMTVIDPIMSKNRKAQKLDNVPQSDRDDFLTTVAHLILASLEPKSLETNGCNTSKEYHLEIVQKALENIAGPARCAKHAETSRIRPSPHIGLLLCQLLLGIPGAENKWSPMMAAWAPELVTTEDRANVAANMEKASDIHDATIKMINMMIPYFLKDADTRDLSVWGFIYVILVFMRSLNTRPDLLKRFGSAFHAEILAPFVNMLLREDETRIGRALESASQSEVVIGCSLLNPEEKPGNYGLTTTDNIRRFLCTREKLRNAEGAMNMDATAGNTTIGEAMISQVESLTIDAATEKDQHTNVPSHRQMYTNVLPEHELLRGYFFTREASPCDKSLEISTKNAVVVVCPPTPEATQAAVEQTHDGVPTNSESEGKVEGGEQAEGGAGEALLPEVEKVIDIGEIQVEDITAQKKKSEKARKQEERLRDPPLFPAKWFDNTKYGFEERQVRQNHVQDAESCDARSVQIVRLASQLIGVFFISVIDDEGRLWFSVPGVLSAPQPDPTMKMPEVVERAGGIRVVYVHPFLYPAEIKKQKARQKDSKEEEEEGQKAKGIHKVSAAVYISRAKQATNAIKQQSLQSERIVNYVDAPEASGAIGTNNWDDQPISAYSLSLGKIGRSAEATTKSLEKPTFEDRPSSIGIKDEMETMLLGKGLDQSEGAKGSGADTTAPAAPAHDPATDPQTSAQLTTGTLDAIPGRENRNRAIKLWLPRERQDGKVVVEGGEEDDWTHVSDESHEGTQTALTAQVDSRSVISRLLFRW